MIESGVDRFGAEYKRTDNDLRLRWIEQDNCVCGVCHGTGAKIAVNYVTRDYASNNSKHRICKTLQAHGHSVWICSDCLKRFDHVIKMFQMRGEANEEGTDHCTDL